MCSKDMCYQKIVFPDSVILWTIVYIKEETGAIFRLDLSRNYLEHWQPLSNAHNTLTS